ncbi:MAG: serine/threonine-protein kinase [Sandaracinaceae bacterium]
MTPSVRTFGKYLLDEEIARGGMSRVHMARLRGLGGFEKRLVVKQVLPELARDPRFVEMFVQEAKTLVQMSHPHIVPVYELGVVDGVYFLAMEYVEGATLSEILVQGPLAPELVAHLGAEICDALHYAHERFGIVHRDVTPRNIIIDPEGHSRLLDFGIAAPADDDGNELFGTPGYLSPEQLEGDAGPQSDVFSLGAALFEALAGRQAFPALTVEETRAALAEEGPAFRPSETVPEELARIVLRALARDPSERFETARELGRALRGFLAAHSPQGVAPELGACAVLAESQAQRRRASRVPDTEEPISGDATPGVQTLAANRAFESMIRESEQPGPTHEAISAGTFRIPRAAAPDVGDEDATLSESPGTMPIEGRRSIAPPEVDEAPGTARIESRRIVEEQVGPEAAAADDDDHDADDDADHDDRRGGRLAKEAGAERTAPVTPRPSTSSAGPWAFALASLAVVAIGVYAIWFSPPRADGGDGDPIAMAADAGRAFDAGGTREDAGVDAGVDAGIEDAGEADAGETDAGDDSEAVGGARATITVNARPWASVTLDGRSLGNTPVRAVAVRAGTHTIELRNEYLAAPLTRRFELAPGAHASVFANLEDEHPTIQVRAGR